MAFPLPIPKDLDNSVRQLSEPSPYTLMSQHSRSEFTQIHSVHQVPMHNTSTTAIFAMHSQSCPVSVQIFTKAPDNNRKTVA